MSCGQQGIAWLRFSLPVSVKDRPLQWMLGKSRIYYPEHILGYGRRKDLFLSYGGNGGGLSTTLSPGLRSGGLESKFGRGPRPLDRRVVGWSCLCLGYKRGVCLKIPSWDTLVHESPCDTVQLGYDLAP